MKTDGSTARPQRTAIPPLNMVFDSLAASLSKDLAAKLTKNPEPYKGPLTNKEAAAALMSEILAELDGVEDQVCRAVDYLQCQVEHTKNQDRVMSVLEHNGRFAREVLDFREVFHELRHTLMERIRYGKRSEELDELLMRMGQLMQLASQAPHVQPVVSFAGMDKALSPRCASCTAECISAHRIVQVFLRRLIQSAQRLHPTAKAADNSAKG